VVAEDREGKVVFPGDKWWFARLKQRIGIMPLLKLIVFDDELALCELISEFAAEAEFEAVSATTVDAFLAHLRAVPADVVAIDLHVPGVHTDDVMRCIAESRPNAAVLLMTGAAEEAFANAERLGRRRGLRICGRLQKPFTLEEIIDLLKRLHGEIEHC